MPMSAEQADLLRSGTWLVSEDQSIYRLVCRTKSAVVLIHLGRADAFLHETEQARVDWPIEALQHMTPFEQHRRAPTDG